MSEFKERFVEALSAIAEWVGEDVKQYMLACLVTQHIPEDILTMVVGFFMGRGWEIPEDNEDTGVTSILEYMAEYYTATYGG